MEARETIYIFKEFRHTLGDPTIRRGNNYIITVAKKRGLKKLKNTVAVSPSL